MPDHPFKVGDIVRINDERLEHLRESEYLRLKDQIYTIEMIRGRDCFMVSPGTREIMWYASSLELCDLCYCDDKKAFQDSCFDCMEKIFP